MKCTNCKTDLKKLTPLYYYCEKCNELYTLDKDKLSPVSDKKKVLDDLKSQIGNAGTLLYDIADKLGVDIGEDTESAFPFI